MDRTEAARIRGRVAPVAGHGELPVLDSGDALHQEPGRLARINGDDELSDPRRAREPADEQPIALAQRGLHAPAGDRDPEESTRRYFLVAQKMSAISLTAACSSAAAAATTVCLFFEQSFAAFQNVSCSFGYFSRCSGLK